MVTHRQKRLCVRLPLVCRSTRTLTAEGSAAKPACFPLTNPADKPRLTDPAPALTDLADKPLIFAAFGG